MDFHRSYRVGWLSLRYQAALLGFRSQVVAFHYPELAGSSRCSGVPTAKKKNDGAAISASDLQQVFDVVGDFLGGVADREPR